MTEEPFHLVWTPTSRRALTRLPEEVASAVIELCYGPLAGNPRRLGKALKLALEGLQSARRGDYRVIYRVNEAEHHVEIVAIEHRADAYRQRRR